ncbi:unnamed protein product [Rotaria magnacalcarata]|uniref:Clathrin light chain n=1 Tax=Rotaria magnacalcarata TaxID=392030 RepID=A0A819EE93_9BILA|nr:unnamed protein product [Rotaria magnacalcarata]CAF1374287.1 unnamed protein product [Rotaria magnacalcarata]CAF1917739.1 unnamed protein product [Rotaria magnacalcarata]CAF2073310.1 unnamed protein product [Rotaria magnacalcarata]CAF2107162.1 unnamed protein product [Rotaria magnacalcarata]
MAFDDSFNIDATNMGDGAANNFYNYNDEDPAAEFLEREKRELADITGDTDSNLFANAFDARNNVLNGGLSPNLNVGGSYSPIPTSNSPYQGLSDLSEQINEPEKIRKWREEFSTRISKKDTEEEIKRKEMQEQARKELDDFYKQRAEQLERTKGQNRTNNRTLEDDIFNNRNSSTSNGKVSDWDKITSLCEFNPKNNRSQKDLTRYRSVLLQLKQQQTSGK